MKVIYIVAIMLLPIIVFAQKTYEFDYMLVYKLTHFSVDSTKQNKIYLTISKDNSYYAVVHELDSLNYSLVLHDNDELHSKVNISKSVFSKTKNVNIDCHNVSIYSNKYKHLVEDYEFDKLNDTLIDGKKYSRYLLKSTLKQKKIVRKKIGSHLYIIEEATNFHLPVFEHPTAYEEWKTKKAIPSGIFLKMFVFNYKGGKTSVEELHSFKKINKNINIIGECNQSNNLIIEIKNGFGPR